MIRPRMAAMVCLALLWCTPAWAQRRDMTRSVVQGDTMYTLGSPGMIPAIMNPEFLPVREARDLFADDEPLLVVQVGDLVRGYSTWHLDRHEVVNERLGDMPLAVTW